jgi:sugar lactone lactonase YvrE
MRGIGSGGPTRLGTVGERGFQRGYRRCPWGLGDPRSRGLLLSRGPFDRLTLTRRGRTHVVLSKRPKMQNLSKGRYGTWIILLCSLCIIELQQPANAIVLYLTLIGDRGIASLDTATGAMSRVCSTPSEGGPDSLLFDTDGRIIYSEPQAGAVRRFDPSNRSTELLASGMTQDKSFGPHDLALEPDGSSVLVSDVASGRIYRINLTTKALTILKTFPGGHPAGLIYDNEGHLFVNLWRGPVVELNPKTGTVLQRSPELEELDGLTFDSSTHKLWAVSYRGSLYILDPEKLAAGVNRIPLPAAKADGIAADGKGDIFVVITGNDGMIYRYSVANKTFQSVGTIIRPDDVAPLSGFRPALSSNNQVQISELVPKIAQPNGINICFPQERRRDKGA